VYTPICQINIVVAPIGDCFVRQHRINNSRCKNNGDNPTINNKQQCFGPGLPLESVNIGRNWLFIYSYKSGSNLQRSISERWEYIYITYCCQCCRICGKAHLLTFSWKQALWRNRIDENADRKLRVIGKVAKRNTFLKRSMMR
jgi:hypothetical protein